MKVQEVADSVRSKNAGPFWITIDIFCGNAANYEQVSRSLTSHQVAGALGQDVSAIKRFDIESLNVVKFSVHRPVVQGHHRDRDQHGAQWAVLIQALELKA